MSIVRPLLNGWLRLTEKRYLARVAGPEDVRRSFERSVRLYFRAPSGTQRNWGPLGGRPALTITRRGGADGREVPPIWTVVHRADDRS